MKTALAALIAATALSACAASSESSFGSDRDAHGCIGSAGYSWSALKQTCVQPWNAADIKLDDPANSVYVVLSADKAQAEIFAADVPQNTVLEAVKGGYMSKNGKVRLMRENQKWRLIK